jgi:hypothetical protein
MGWEREGRVEVLVVDKGRLGKNDARAGGNQPDKEDAVATSEFRHFIPMITLQAMHSLYHKTANDVIAGYLIIDR